MASPKISVFFLFDSSGTLLPGVTTATFLTYKDTTGANVTAPTIYEIGGTGNGGGAYYFTPVFPTDKGIVFAVGSGSGSAFPACQTGFLRPEDFATDNISTLMQYQQGRWKIHTTGPDIYRLVFYAPDGVTAIQKFDLLDKNGAGVFKNPMERLPVP